MSGRAQAFTIAAAGADAQLCKQEQYLGFTVRETAAGAASFIIRATSAAGPILDYVKLASGQSTGDWYGPQGKNAPGGIWLDWISGTFDITVFAI